MGQHRNRLFLLLLQPATVQYICSIVLHTPSTAYVDRESYRKSITFWSDLAITGFAVALLFEGIALICSRRAMIVLAALFVTSAATLGNLLYLLYSYPTYGLALISAMAVIFGIYIAIPSVATVPGGAPNVINGAKKSRTRGRRPGTQGRVGYL